MANEIESGTIDCEADTLAGDILASLSSFVSADDLPKVLTAFKRFAAGVAIGWVNNVIASITDGKYLQVSGGEIVGGDGGEGSEGAPVGAAYLVATAHADLTAERVATNTTTVTWDFGVAGQAKANVPDATTTSKGVVELATDGENSSSVVVRGNDSRLSDARTPLAHSHDITDLDGYSGNAAQVLRGDATWGGVPLPAADVQSFTAAGTYAAGVDGWTKPSTGTMALIIVTGAGGGGGGGGTASGTTGRTAGTGGGGGAKHIRLVPLSMLGATETVIVGAGGTGGTAGNSGNTGGSSQFGSSALVFAGGGGPGLGGTQTVNSRQGGGGGGIGASGSVGSTSQTRNEGGPGYSIVETTTQPYGASGGTGCRGGFGSARPAHAEYGGGGGGGSATGAAQAGGTSLYGGGGGGCGGFYSTASRQPQDGGLSGTIQEGGGESNQGGNSSTLGVNPTAGSDGTDATHMFMSGGGGGGGGGSSYVGGVAPGNNGAVGGDGGFPGGGGGGGGAGGGGSALSMGEGAAGGDGADGAVHVIVF